MINTVELFRPGVEAATELGHARVADVHLVLGFLKGHFLSGEALRSCGIDYEALQHAVNPVWQEHLERGPPRGPSLPPGANWFGGDVRSAAARARGIAAGLGTPEARPQHLLLGLVFEPNHLDVAGTLQREFNVGRDEILAELAQRGVKVNSPPASVPQWGEWFSVSVQEFERRACDLYRAGVLYRYGHRKDHVLMSIDQRGSTQNPSLALELRKAVFQEAAELEHSWICDVHLLLTLLRGESLSGEALLACGLDYQAVKDRIAGRRDLHDHYNRGGRNLGSMKTSDDEEKERDACAHGIALGTGGAYSRSECLLLGLLWTPSTHSVWHVLEQEFAVTRAHVLAELRRRGVRLDVSLPQWPEAPVYVSPELLARRASELTADAFYYTFSDEGDHVLFVAPNKAPNT